MWTTIALICISALESFKLEAATIAGPEVSPFLINGKEAAPGQFPYLAHITFWFIVPLNRHTDSATLISDRHLLAKAGYLISGGDIDVVLGAHQPLNVEPDQQRFTAKYDDLIFPPEIISGFDLAIIKLPQRARFTDFVQPVLLPRWSDRGRNYVGTRGIVIGWTKDPAAAYAEVEISQYYECGSLELPGTMCVQKEVLTNGDRGAPLVGQTVDGPVVLGIYSHASLVLKEGKLLDTNVFIQLNEHLEFIANNIEIYIRP